MHRFPGGSPDPLPVAEEPDGAPALSSTTQVGPAAASDGGRAVLGGLASWGCGCLRLGRVNLRFTSSSLPGPPANPILRVPGEGGRGIVYAAACEASREEATPRSEWYQLVSFLAVAMRFFFAVTRGNYECGAWALGDRCSVLALAGRIAECKVQVSVKKAEPLLACMCKKVDGCHCFVSGLFLGAVDVKSSFSALALLSAPVPLSAMTCAHV